MKKNFTLPFCLSLIAFLVFKPSLQAQSWQDVGADSTALQYSEEAGVGLTLATDSAGNPYVFLVNALDGNADRGPVYIQHYDGANWIALNTTIPGFPGSIQSYETEIAGAVDRKGNAFVGVNSGHGMPEAYEYLANSFTQLGPASSGDIGSSPDIILDNSGIPYFAFYDYYHQKPAVYRFDGTSWQPLDTADLGNGQQGRITQIVFDRQNNLYIAYDEVNPNSGQASYLVIEKYNGTNWVRVGSTTLYSTNSAHVLAFDNTNTPYVVCSTGNDTTGYNFRLEKLSGGDWTVVGPVVSSVPGSPGKTGAPAASDAFGNAQIYLAMGLGNTPYIAWYQNYSDTNLKTTQQILVDKFNGTSWVPAATNAVSQVRPLFNAISFISDTLGDLYISYIQDFFITHVKKLQQTNISTITFAMINKTYGDPDFLPGATSTNADPGDPIRYTIADTTVATIVNGNVHIKKAGFTSITASQPADSLFAAAQPVTVDLDVLRATQSITWPGWPQKKVGDPDFAAGASASSGAPVTYEGSDPTIATVSSDGTIHIIEQGAIVVTAHQTGDSNYLAAPDLQQVLIITDTDTTATTPPVTTKPKLSAYSSGKNSLLVIVDVSDDQSARLELYTGFGLPIYSKEIFLSSKGDNQFTIPVGRFPEGIYFVRVIGRNINLVQTVLIR